MAPSRTSAGFTREDLSLPRPSSDSRLRNSAKRAMTVVTTVKAFVKKVSLSQPPPPPPQSTFRVLRKASQHLLTSQNVPFSQKPLFPSRSCRPGTAGTAVSASGLGDMSTPGLCVTHPTTKGKNLTLHVVPDSPAKLSANDVHKIPKKKPHLPPARFGHPNIPVVLDVASEFESRCSTPSSPKSWRTVESDVVIGTESNDAPLSPKDMFRKSEDNFGNFAAKMDGVPPFSPRPSVPISATAPQLPENRKMSSFHVFDDKPVPPPPPPAFPHGHPTILKPKVNRQSVPLQSAPAARATAPRPWSCAPPSKSGTHTPLLPYIPYKPNFDPYRPSPPPTPGANTPKEVPEKKEKKRSGVKRKPVPKPSPPPPSKPSPAPAPKAVAPPATKSSSTFKMNDSGFPVHSRSSANRFSAPPAYQSRTQDLVEKKFKRDEAAKLARIAERQKAAQEAHYKAMNAGRRRFGVDA